MTDFYIVVDHSKPRKAGKNPMMRGYYHEIMGALKSMGHSNIQQVAKGIFRVTDHIHVWDEERYEGRKF